MCHATRRRTTPLVHVHAQSRAAVVHTDPVVAAISDGLGSNLVSIEGDTGISHADWRGASGFEGSGGLGQCEGDGGVAEESNGCDGLDNDRVGEHFVDCLVCDQYMLSICRRSGSSYLER